MRSHDQRNEQSRTRLIAAVGIWKRGAAPKAVATLTHLAWWDRYYANRWRARIAGDTDAHQGLGAGRTDAINEAGAAMWEALAFDDAARLALEAADNTDALIAGLSEELVQETESRGAHRLLERAIHRNEHLSELGA